MAPSSPIPEAEKTQATAPEQEIKGEEVGSGEVQKKVENGPDEKGEHGEKGEKGENGEKDEHEQGAVHEEVSHIRPRSFSL